MTRLAVLEQQIALALRRPASLWLLGLLAGLPLAFAAWLLLAPEIMVSQQSVTDLLFNLAGAWQLQHGRVQHVDFHEAVGALNFWLTLAGFHLAGFSPRAFLVGVVLMTAALFVIAVIVAWRRLPLLAAICFVLFICLPALMPTNVGHIPDSFTFAMAYNRYGWGAIGILCLMLFVPPQDATAQRSIDLACGLLLLLLMFYVKITYFLTGLGALALALCISEHIRARRGLWLLMGLLAIGNALAPHSHAYLADIGWALQSGLANTGLSRILLQGILGNNIELAAYGVGFIAAFSLWRQRLAPLRLPLAALFLIVASVALFTQNTQIRGLPLGMVLLFMLYAALLPQRALSSPAYLLALLLLPAMTILASAGSLAAYFHSAVPSANLLIVETTNIRQLAVPKRGAAHGALRPQTIYFDSLLQAASLFDNGQRRPGRIQLLDRVNPLPFMLGFEPPRGADLFWEPTAPPRAAETVLGDADYVLLPKASTAPGFSETLHQRYAPYLAQHFPLREETALWILYTRAPRP